MSKNFLRPQQSTNGNPWRTTGSPAGQLHGPNADTRGTNPAVSCQSCIPVWIIMIMPCAAGTVRTLQKGGIPAA
ncbi:hypothetical protein FXV77_21930, partial [Sphingobacterium phlebotomi]